MRHKWNGENFFVKAYQYVDSSGIDGLQSAEIPAPIPGPRQVLIQVHAVSLNYKDLYVAKGLPHRDENRLLIPISDGAGEVIEAGSHVTRFKKGDRVTSTVAPSWIAGRLTDEIAKEVLGTTVDGMLCEYVALDESGVAAIPAHLSYEEAATLPCAGLTAWNAFSGNGAVKPGDTVLVQGSGGVSIFALQFAQLFGARVIGISSSDDKLRKMKELGLAVGVNYITNPEWDEEVLRATAGHGVDHVIEVGGAGTLEKSFRVVRRGGTISLIGVLSGFEGTVNPLPVLLKGIRLQGASVGPREVFEEMNRAITQHAIWPVIDRVFPFEEAREALHHLESGKHFGKIVVRVTEKN